MPDELETLTIRPQPRSPIGGAAARIRRIGAITFSSQAAYQSSSGTSSRSRRRAVPALLTSTSSWPRRSSASRDDPVGRLRLGDVDRQRLGPAARGLARRGALVGGLDQPILGASDQQHVRSLGAEHPSGGAADAAAGAGHHAGAAAEPEVHASVLVLDVLDQLERVADLDVLGR